MAYAEKTSVSSSKSRAEIEKLLTNYGASEFAYGWGKDHAIIGFKMENRKVKYLLPLPAKDSNEVVYTNHAYRKQRSKESQEKAFEQLARTKWRALFIVLKAKFVAIEAGITCFEDEFMANILLPNGKTVGTLMKPQIESAYNSGQMPPLLEWKQ